MKSVNKVTLLGNATRNAEIGEYEGAPACNFSLATNRTYRDADGELCSFAEVSRVIAVGPLVSVCLDLVKKGKPIYLEGYMKTDEGTTWIIADEVVLLAQSARVEE
jgi:single-strand DNA-binding protein